MRALGLTIGIVATLLLAGTPSPVQASTSLAYRIHEVPDDPNSPITFTVVLKVEELDREGDSVGWEVLEARFRQSGNGARTWIQTAPFLATPDGLWWIAHINPDHPAIEEFVLPPEMTGTAVAQASGEDDLDFSFTGVAWDTQLKGSPYAVTGGLTYAFALVGETEPLEVGEDGPVQVESGKEE